MNLENFFDICEYDVDEILLDGVFYLHWLVEQLTNDLQVAHVSSLCVEKF